VPPFRAAQIVGARFAFFVSLAHGSMGNPGGIRGQTERFLLLFEKTRFADNDWRFSEWGDFPSVPTFPHVSNAKR
jgi:hypothetical protein